MHLTILIYALVVSRTVFRLRLRKNVSQIINRKRRVFIQS